MRFNYTNYSANFTSTTATELFYLKNKINFKYIPNKRSMSKSYILYKIFLVFIIF